MAEFTNRTEMAYKLGIELQVARIDEIKTDSGTPATIVKTMGRNCIVTNDYSHIAQVTNPNLRYYELGCLSDYAKLLSTGKYETNGIPMYWLGNIKTGTFTIKPKIYFLTATQAFADLYNNLTERSTRSTASYARSVLNRDDLINTSLYLNGAREYEQANLKFMKIYNQQNQK